MISDIAVIITCISAYITILSFFTFLFANILGI